MKSSTKALNAQTLKKYSTHIFIGVISLLLIIILFLAFSERDEEVSDLKTGISISMKEGDVLFSGNGEIWEFADKETVLRKGYLIRTGDGSKAVLKTPNGSLIRLNENSEIKVARVNKEDVLLVQNYGRTYHRVKFDSGAVYQVSALDHTIKTIGTAFDVSVNEKANRINVKVLEGKVKVSINSKKDVDAQTLEKGKEITVDPARENVFTSADISADYVNSDWFKWNKERDKEYGYKLSIADKIPEETGTGTATATATGTGTGTGTTPKTPAYTGGSCKSPYLTAKKDIKFGGIKLNWTTCSSGSFQFYKVVRSALNSNPSYPNDGVITSSSNKNYANYLDKNLVRSKTYHYRVCVVERLNKISCGNVVSIAY